MYGRSCRVYPHENRTDVWIWNKGKEKKSIYTRMGWIFQEQQSKNHANSDTSFYPPPPCWKIYEENLFEFLPVSNGNKLKRKKLEHLVVLEDTESPIFLWIPPKSEAFNHSSLCMVWSSRCARMRLIPLQAQRKRVVKVFNLKNKLTLYHIIYGKCAIYFIDCM